MAFVSHLYPKHSLILHTRHLYCAAPPSDLDVIYRQSEVELFWFLSNSRMAKKKIFVVFNKIYRAYVYYLWCILHAFWLFWELLFSVPFSVVPDFLLICPRIAPVSPRASFPFFFLLTSPMQRRGLFVPSLSHAPYLCHWHIIFKSHHVI